MTNTTRTKTRALANTPNDYVSVLDYGAVGDGITDDTDAFKAALATYKEVRIPSGNYRITSSLPYPGNSPEGGIIKGEGQSTKLVIDIADPNSPWLFEADKDNVSGNGYDWNIRGYTFRDFTVINFDNNTAYARKNGVFYFNGRTITASVIDNVHTLNVPQVVQHTGDTWGRGVKITNCRFDLSTTTIDDCFGCKLGNYCSIDHTDIIGGWTYCVLGEGRITVRDFNIGGQSTNSCEYSIYIKDTQNCIIQNGYIEYCGRSQSGTKYIDAVVLDNSYNNTISDLYAMQGMNIAAINCDPVTRSSTELPPRKVVDLSNINYGGETSAKATPHFKCKYPVFVSSDARSIGMPLKPVNSQVVADNSYRLIPKFGTWQSADNGIFDQPYLVNGLPDSTKITRRSSTFTIANASDRLLLRCTDGANTLNTADTIVWDVTGLRPNRPVTAALALKLDSRQTASGLSYIYTNTNSSLLLDSNNGDRNLWLNFAGLNNYSGDVSGTDTWKNTDYTLYCPGIVAADGTISLTLRSFMGGVGGDTHNNVRVHGIQMFYGFNVFTDMELIYIP